MIQILAVVRKDYEQADTISAVSNCLKDEFLVEVVSTFGAGKEKIENARYDLCLFDFSYAYALSSKDHWVTRNADTPLLSIGYRTDITDYKKWAPYLNTVGAIDVFGQDVPAVWQYLGKIVTAAKEQKSPFTAKEFAQAWKNAPVPKGPYKNIHDICVDHRFSFEGNSVSPCPTELKKLLKSGCSKKPKGIAFG